MLPTHQPSVPVCLCCCSRQQGGGRGGGRSSSSGPGPTQVLYIQMEFCPRTLAQVGRVLCYVGNPCPCLLAAVTDMTCCSPVPAPWFHVVLLRAHSHKTTPSERHLTFPPCPLYTSPDMFAPRCWRRARWQQKMPGVCCAASWPPWTISIARWGGGGYNCMWCVYVCRGGGAWRLRKPNVPCLHICLSSCTTSARHTHTHTRPNPHPHPHPDLCIPPSRRVSSSPLSAPPSQPHTCCTPPSPVHPSPRPSSPPSTGHHPPRPEACQHLLRLQGRRQTGRLWARQVPRQPRRSSGRGRRRWRQWWRSSGRGSGWWGWWQGAGWGQRQPAHQQR